MRAATKPRRRHPLHQLVGLVCCLAFPSGILAAQDEVGIKRGTEAPAVQIEDLDGNVADLGESVGVKPMLIEFWASWCENCEALAPKMEQVQREFGNEVEIVAIAVGVGQSQRNVRRHLEKHPVDYRFLYDKKGAAVRAYSAPTTSYVVIVDAAGRVAYTGTGGGQDLVAEVKSVLSNN